MASLRDLFGTIALKAGKGLTDLKTFNKGLDTAQDELGKTEKKTTKLGRGMKTLGRISAKTGKLVAKGMAVGTTAILAGTLALFAFTSAWATSADEIGKSSINLGISSDALQELRFAAKLAGAESGTLSKVLRDLSNKSAEAKLTGTGPFADSLKEMGIELEAFTNLPIDKQLEFLSDELNKIEDTTLRTGLAMRLFGRGAINLGVLIASGSKGIQAGRAELREFGLVMSPEMLERAALLADTIARVGAFFDALKNTIGAKLAPVVTKYLIRFNKLLLAHKGVIALKIEKVFMALVQFLEKGIPLLADTVILVTDFVNAMGGIDSAIRTAAEAWLVFQLAGLAAMGPAGALAAAIGLTALGIARVGRELEKKKREARELDNRLRNPDDPLAGLTPAQLASENGKILQASALAAAQATGALRQTRSKDNLQQSQVIRDDAAADEFGHEFAEVIENNTQEQIDADERLLKASQRHAERLQEIARRDREAFDKLQAMDLAERTRAQAVLDESEAARLSQQLADADGKDPGTKTTGATAKADAKAKDKKLTPAEQLAAAFGGTVTIAGNPFERLGTGSTINQIDARVFVNVGGVSNSFPLPAGTTPEQVAKIAEKTTAVGMRDQVEEAFSHHRNVFVT